MRALCRFSIAAAVLCLALILSPSPSRSDDCVYCYQEGNCLICIDYCIDQCTYECRPGGDGYC
jgi:hypothetical protein